MLRLTSAIEKKLNDPEVIVKISEQILKKRGVFDFEFIHDPKIDDETLMYYFQDLPARKIFIRGSGHFPKELEDAICSKHETQSKFLHSFLFQAKNFKSHFDNLNICFGMKSSNYVFHSSYNKEENKIEVINFEKGLWQKYLANIYLSILKVSEIKSLRYNLLL